MEKNKVGLVVVRHDELVSNTAQTSGLPRLEGVSPTVSGSAGLWMGRVTGSPGMDSGPHHHGEAETGGYVLSGSARIFFGEEYEEYVDVFQGDFLYVPPFMPHIETNLSDVTPVEFVTCRFPGNNVVNLNEEPNRRHGLHV
jgi:uncharacterized RmlC-like cupin family protein